MAKRDPYEAQCLLWRAVEEGCLEDAHTLIRAGATGDWVEEDGETTVLMRAAELGHLGLVQALVGAGADVDAYSEAPPDPSDPDPLVADELPAYGLPVTFAALRGHRDIAAYLLPLTGDREERERARWIVEWNAGGLPEATKGLFRAAASGRATKVRELIDRGADVDARNMIGATPIYLAVANGRVKAAEVLLRAGADPTIAPPNQPTLAEAASHPQIRELLGLSDPGGLVGALINAACKGMIGTIRALAAAGADLDGAGERGDTPLGGAVRCLQPKAALLLLERGANPDRPDREGKTPLMDASQGLRAQPELVEALLRAGADANRRDARGFTALMWALVGGVPDQPNRERTVRLLLGAGTEVNFLNNEGKSPYSFAEYWGRDEMLPILREAGADPELGRVDVAALTPQQRSRLEAEQSLRRLSKLIEEATAPFAGKTQEEAEAMLAAESSLVEEDHLERMTGLTDGLVAEATMEAADLAILIETARRPIAVRTRVLREVAGAGLSERLRRRALKDAVGELGSELRFAGQTPVGRRVGFLRSARSLGKRASELDAPAAELDEAERAVVEPLMPVLRERAVTFRDRLVEWCAREQDRTGGAVEPLGLLGRLASEDGLSPARDAFRDLLIALFRLGSGEGAGDAVQSAARRLNWDEETPVDEAG